MPRVFNMAEARDRRHQLRKPLTKTEALVWSKLRGRQILGYYFRRQYSVGPFVLDFYCTALKLAVEIDGDSHFREGAQEYDQNREAFIGSFGIKFIRFTNEDVHRNLDGVLESIVEFAQKCPRQKA